MKTPRVRVKSFQLFFQCIRPLYNVRIIECTIQAAVFFYLIARTPLSDMLLFSAFVAH
jgi:hypothetical protein